MVLRFTHDALCELDPATGNLIPCLAQEVTQDPNDQLLWWIVLRDGARFATGRPVEADDARWTLAAAQTEGVGPGTLTSILRGIEFVRDPGKQNARFGLRMPPERRFDHPDLMREFRILDRVWFADRLAELAHEETTPAAGTAAFADALMQVRCAGPATGPYRLLDGPTADTAWRRGRDLRIVQNPDCWQRRVYPERWNLAGMSLRFLADRTAAWAALERGELDWIVDAGDATNRLRSSKTLRERYVLLEYTRRSSSHVYCEWNHHHEGLDDANVRRALTMLFDRDSIVADLYGGAAQVASSWLPPNHPAYPDDLSPLPFSPARARSMLGNAGYTDTSPLRLTIVTDGAGVFQEVANGLVAAAKDCGNVEVTVRLMPWPMIASARTRYASGEIAGSLLVHGHGLAVDPATDFGATNPMGFSDQKNIELLDAIGAAEDTRARNRRPASLGATHP